ncbi:MAG: CHASE3 domain-containing protein [Ferruginibacter sp.]
MIKSLKEIANDLRVKAGYASAFIILLISYLLTLYGNNQLMKQTVWVNKTSAIIHHLEILVSGMKDAETGLRGYILTRDTAFLAPYKNSFTVVNNNLQTLKSETKDNPVQQENLKGLADAISTRYKRFAFALQTFDNNNFVLPDTLLKSFKIAKEQMDKIRSIVSSMQMYEQDLLTTRNKELDDKYIALNIIIITSFIIALVFALFGFYTYRKENKARVMADHKVAEYQNELQQQIAELDKANAALILMKRSEKFAATGRIARTIAHEVRNPLTNIGLAVAQIKADMPALDEGTDMLFDIVTRNSMRINHLISELLDATRFAELNFAPVLINTIVDEALELAKDRIELNYIKVEKKYSDDICEISVDTEKVKIAFLNLIVNAIEAMEPYKGVLQIVTKGEDGKCVVEITDNGHGMTDEQLNNIFEPYFSSKENGNGLGLTNTANIILNHKGDISVTSKEGKGTTFKIKFDFSS